MRTAQRAQLVPNIHIFHSWIFHRRLEIPPARKIGPLAPNKWQHEWHPCPILFSMGGGNHQWSVDGSFEVFCMDRGEDEQRRRVPEQLRRDVFGRFSKLNLVRLDFDVVLSFAMSF